MTKASVQLALGGSQAVSLHAHTYLSSFLSLHLVAGVLESLSSMAHAHLELGVASPFLVCLQREDI